ncbi:MAG: serine O-acetyltransferase EpsC [Candidatus Thermoplasmatota archaeon]
MPEKMDAMDDERCRKIFQIERRFRADLAKAIGDAIGSSLKDRVMCHIDTSLIPSREEVVDILHDLEDILFPGFFGKQELDENYLRYHLGNEMNILFEKLAYQITKAYIYGCSKHGLACPDCGVLGQQQAIDFIKRIPKLRELLRGDVEAAYRNDPAAKSYDEVIISYPAIKAIMIYRIAHELHEMGVPIIPRVMTEHAHAITGIDIHPGAKIGRKFFIDHGTGVVIGETTEIGNNVVIYQGVTLGALHFARDEKGEVVRGKKRHPRVEDNVTIYANATILGGDTVIGANSVIGGNVWLVESVPANCKIVTEYKALRITPLPKED